MDEAKIIQKFNDNTGTLISTPMLYPDQKISIINQYIWPQLVYGFQICPLTKLKFGFLDNIDKIIRNSLKCILCLPDDTPTSMIYSAHKNKGLNLFRARWEAFVQKNEHLHYSRNFDSEMDKCLVKLNISKEQWSEMKNLKKTRKTNIERYKSIAERT